MYQGCKIITNCRKKMCHSNQARQRKSHNNFRSGWANRRTSQHNSKRSVSNIKYKYHDTESLKETILKNINHRDV